MARLTQGCQLGPYIYNVTQELSHRLAHRNILSRNMTLDGQHRQAAHSRNVQSLPCWNSLKYSCLRLFPVPSSTSA